MGKTHRHQGNTKFDDAHKQGRGGKHHTHSNNKKTGGMRIINDIYDEEDDYFDDDVSVQDSIVINKTSDDTSSQ